MTPRVAAVLSAASLLLLAGCADGRPGVIHYARTDTSYTIWDLSYVAGKGKGELPTEVLGNPFGTPQPAFDAAVTSYMDGAHFGPVVHFTTTPSDKATDDYRVRLIFNGPAASNGSAVCGGDPAAVPASKENGRVRLLAAFCRGSGALTFLSGELDEVSGVEDPDFRDFIRRATLRLFPPQNPEREPDRCAPPC